jgi:hypothetical protein
VKAGGKHIHLSELLGFWTLSIVRNAKKIDDTTFRKLDLFPSSGEGWETDSVESVIKRKKLALSDGPKRVGVSPLT